MIHRKGFTLIEMLVVLVILGLTSALVLPKFPAIYDRFKSKSELEKFSQSLAVLPLQAYTKQQTITLNQSSANKILELPSAWEIEIPQPIIYKANGVCLGGELSYKIKGQITLIKLVPPYCEPSAS